MRDIKFQVVIPTYKPDAQLKTLLERLNSQTIAPERILVINTEKKYLHESDYAGISNVVFKHITKEEFDHAATRNMAIQESITDFVVFLTQDAMPVDDKLFEEILKPFSDKDVGVVYGRQAADKNCNIIERYTRSFNYPDYDMVKSKEDLPRLGIKTYFSSDSCAAYRKSTYDKLGGFVKEAIFNEDMLYAAKLINAGGKVAYASKAIVLHYHNYGLMEYLHRNFDMGVSQKQHPEVFKKIKSEDEGKKLVKDTMIYLCKRGRFYLVPSLIMKSGFKYIGFRLGKKYDRLSPDRIKKLTMNPGYWERKEREVDIWKY